MTDVTTAKANVLYEKGGIAYVIINRSKVLNVLNGQTLEEPKLQKRCYTNRTS